MSLLQRLKTAFTTRTYFPTDREFVGLYPLGGRSRVKNYDCATVEGQREAYVNCSPLTAIINNKCAMAINGVWSFVDKDDKEVKSKDVARLTDLMRRPNSFQDWNAFFAYAKMMNQIFGRAYIYIERPEGFKDKTHATAMYVLANWDVVADYRNNDNLNRFVTKPYQYRVTLNGATYEVQPEDMLIWNDVGFDLLNRNYDYTLGASRLLSLADPIANIIDIRGAHVQLTSRPSGGSVTRR
jgi:hypothetical protein